MSCKLDKSSLPTSNRPKLTAKKKKRREKEGSSEQAVPRGDKPSEQTIETETDTTQEIHESSNHCLATMAYNDDGDELDRDGNIQWVQAAKKSLLDGDYMVDPIRLGLAKAIRVTSLVMRFIDILKGRRHKFNVINANPNALLNYMDRDFIGLRNKGADTMHTSNWNKVASNTRRKTDPAGRRQTPTTLSEISTLEQLLMNSKSFTDSNWMVYPGVKGSRDVLSELVELVGLSEKKIDQLSSQRILEHLCKLCWLDAYINALSNSRRYRRELQSVAYALRSDLNTIVNKLNKTSLTTKMTELWEAERKLNYPTLIKHVTIMS